MATKMVLVAFVAEIDVNELRRTVNPDKEWTAEELKEYLTTLFEYAAMEKQPAIKKLIEVG